MSRKVLSIVVPVVVVAVVVGVITFVVVQDKGGADALTVNGQSVSQVTVNNELRALAHFGGNTPSAPGAIGSTTTGNWLTSRVAAVAIGQLLERRGAQITAKEYDQGFARATKTYKGLPDSAIDVATLITLGESKLSDELGSQDTAVTAITREMRRSDVSVDPKYGRWARAVAAVCPWTGCPKANAQSSGSSG